MPGKKTGRRPKSGSRMPSTAISAPVEDLIFLMLLGDGEVSGGIRQAIGRLQKEEDGAARMRQAARIRGRIEAILKADGNQDVKQVDIYRHVTQHFHELLDKESTE